MPDKKPEAAPAEGEGGKPAAKEEAGRGGAIKSWLPLILSLVLMPALAFATTKFLIIPKIAQAREVNHGDDAESEDPGRREAGKDGGRDSKEPGKGKESAKSKEPREGKESAKTHAGRKKQSVQIAKVIVNVAGTSGSRYLMTSFTLTGTHNDFKNVIEENKDQLLDL